MKLFNNKIFIFVLLTCFTSSLANGAICELSHVETETSPSKEKNKLEQFSDNLESNYFFTQNSDDECENLEISSFIANVENSKHGLSKLVLISSDLNQEKYEYLSERNLCSKYVRRIPSSPQKIPIKIYRLNSLFLI